MNVAIVGATGYGGMQLVSLLKDNNNYKISFLGGNKSAGSKWNDIFPFINISDNLMVETIDPNKIAENSDIAILSLPNGVSSQITPKLLKNGIKVIDLSADYRYKSLDKWKEIYKRESKIYKREDYELCEEAVYGLTEINYEVISKSRLIACPGCYPTSSLIPLFPLLSQGIIDNDGIIIDSKSATSGGGREPKQNLLLSECSEGLSAYGLINHRHTSEIEGILSRISGIEIELLFTPHLIPMARGMFTTIYCRLKDPGLTSDDCKILLESYYRNFPNIKILPVGVYPSTKWVRNTNNIFLSLNVDKRNGRLVILSVLDNLLKGQAGQSLQNLNLIYGLDSNEGLEFKNFYP